MSIQIRFGMQKYKGFGGELDGEVQWFDTPEDVMQAHKEQGYKNANIYAYGLGSQLTRVYYLPWGGAAGYHYFGIYPEMMQLCRENGVDDTYIWHEVMKNK